VAPLPEISLARSAAAKSISGDAEILILTKSSFQTAVSGTNGFVCMVARSWSADFSDPDFWDPKLRAPICYSALAARSQVPATIKRTQVALAGGSKTHILKAVKVAVESGELSTAESGSMAYMMSTGAYLSNRVDHWLPHLMFSMSETDPKSWGAGLSDYRNQTSGGTLDRVYRSPWQMVGRDHFEIRRALNNRERKGWVLGK
jgi:hypothetical protein